jgi:hypothetical protein
MGLGQVAHADAAAADLVLIGRTDTAPGGADLARDILFSGQVNGLVPGHDDMQIAVHQQLVIILEITLLFQVLDFAKKNLRVEHHAIADDTSLAGMQDAGRDQMQNDGLITDDQGVTSIVAPLVTHYVLGVFGIDIDNFPFAFVTPLGADYDDVCHGFLRILLNLE